MTRIGRLALISILLLAGVPLFAQDQKVTLAYFEDNSGDFRMVSHDGAEEKYSEDLAYGDALPLNWTLVTGDDDTAELKLEHNGTIIKISENTNFRIDALQGLEGASVNTFALGFGKFRAVAGRITGDERYEFKTQSATCGVRGTDFGMQRQVLGGKEVEEAFVFQGTITVTNLSTGQTIVLKTGESADARVPEFTPKQMSPAKIKILLSDLEFKKLNVEAVPKEQLKPQLPGPLSEELEGKEAQGPEELKAQAEAEQKLLEEEKAELLSKGESRAISFGFEFGSLTIGDETYARAVFSPQIELGSFKMALYLPVIYSQDILNPADWYRPKGNNEWSFGTDQNGDSLKIIQDIGVDLALKIKYLQFGKPRDPFFIKLGNIDSFTFGHGLIVRGYSNDSDFPALRRLGVNLGLDFKSIGFEAMTSDLTELEIFGARLYSRPAAAAFPLGFGISTVFDLNPASGLPDNMIAQIGNPFFIGAGFDLDFPFAEGDAFSLVLFSDIGGVLPYFRNNGTGIFSNVEQGPAWDTIIQTSPSIALRNFGLASGAYGNFGGFHWRAEYRLSTGFFETGFMNNLYDRQRSAYALKSAVFANDPSAEEMNKINMGIYGEAGYISERVFFIEAAYLMPFSVSQGNWEWEERDFLHFGIGIEKGALPFINLGASISYDRYYFVPLLLYGETKNGAKLTLLDENSVIRTSLIYGPSENLDLIFMLTTTVARGEDGSPIYGEGVSPRIVTTFSFETRIHF